SSGGLLLYQLPHPRRDGSTHLLLDPLALIEKLSVLIPPPRCHLLRFHEILREYTLKKDFEDIRCQWLKSVRGTLRTAWEQHRASFSMGDAWAIRALVKAEAPVFRKLKELNDEILKLEPQEEIA
ncbi:MAG: transposase, partial [Acidobacteria bacterium]|nr:transposase [Acidobacteriota bacterium]